jgi:hypothetical protein
MARISRTFRTRLPATVDQELMAFCTTRNIPTSAAIRWAVRYFLAHQEQAVAELADPPIADPRTPEQQAAWEALERELGAFDRVAALAYYPQA